MRKETREKLEREGFCIVESFVPPILIEKVKEELSAAWANRKSNHSRIGGIRNVGNFASVRQLLASPEFNDQLTPLAETQPVFVRGIFFDKTADSNWKVPWHQDLTIAVREKVDAPGFSGGSIKDGVRHVQPPVSILEQMCTVRIHLDDCDQENGALEVLPGTHLHGKLSADQLQILRKTIEPRVCVCRAGGALLMKPLLMHSSRPAQNRPHRRVLHLEFSPEGLPFGLEWAEALDSRASTPERSNR